jgi:hypothetical protein
VGWLILAAIFGVLGYFLFRAWRVWQDRFANRHEFDADHLALLIAQREELEQPAAEPTPAPRPKPHLPRAPHPAQPVTPAPAPVPAPARAAGPVANLQQTPRKAKAVADSQPSRRKPMLDMVSQAIFLQLRTDLSNYPILASVDIASLLDAHGTTPPRVQADFVVCKKDFSPAVVIFIERELANPMFDRAEALLRQHRLRVLRWRADKLPTREQMRHQIFKPKSS